MLLPECVILCLLVEYTAAHVNTSEKYERTAEKLAEKNGSGGSGYGFFRDMRSRERAGTRRVYGGAAAELQQFPAVCALTDEHRAVRCSCTVLAPRWALTAAHCVNPRVAYVKYNTRRPYAAAGGSSARVLDRFIHPDYMVKQEQHEAGTDVAELHHDVGLVRTEQNMTLATPTASLATLRRYSPDKLYNQEVLVLGYGRTEQAVQGEELYSVRLQLTGCGRRLWVHCVCGHGGADSRGVCSGDSGGPAVLDGVLVGVTSMGPLECASAHGPPVGLTSVFTSLYKYADLINTTVLQPDSPLAMRRVNAAPPARWAAALWASLLLALVR